MKFSIKLRETKHISIGIEFYWSEYFKGIYFSMWRGILMIGVFDRGWKI